MNIQSGQNVYQELIKQGLNVSAFCGGNGKCGKCKIKVISGKLQPTKEEMQFLTSSELQDGIRLACFHKNIKEDIQISVLDESKSFSITGSKKNKYETKKEEGIGVAVDVGTTTIVIVGIDLLSGEKVFERRLMNPQRRFGADVISRIQACKEFGVSFLQKSLLDSLKKEFDSFDIRIKRIFLCGNSTMEHIALGIDPTPLSEFPYTCVFEELQQMSAYRLIQSISLKDAKLTILPNISAFVGGDIVAGIQYTKLYENDRCLLIDLGTNGEMALSVDGTIYTTSAAAGPAFEGGNMKCGVASISGAITGVDGETYKTIDGKSAIGICGTGYIEWIAKLYKDGLMDETGYMEKEYYLNDTIMITPEDIRNFQLSKSAIRSAIDVLCRQAKTKYKDIHRIFISGGFGQALSIESLITLKILPHDFFDKVFILGNTALEGTINVMIHNDISILERIKENAKSIDLSKDPDFNQLFMENMWF